MSEVSTFVARPYRGKRVVDAVVLLVVALPALVVSVLCAAAVRCTSKGPVLFRQTRVGWQGRDFELLKFRSMVDGDNPIVPDATRITRVGKWLRATSLDELPQLVNVLRGDMSVVGPRPTLRYQVEQYDDRQRQRLAVRPGLTGLAQISGRNALSWAQRIELDLDYVRTQSWRTDVRILLRTPVVLIRGEGVTGHDPADPLVIDPLVAGPEGDDPVVADPLVAGHEGDDA